MGDEDGTPDDCLVGPDDGLGSIVGLLEGLVDEVGSPVGDVEERSDGVDDGVVEERRDGIDDGGSVGQLSHDNTHSSLTIDPFESFVQNLFVRKSTRSALVLSQSQCF